MALKYELVQDLHRDQRRLIANKYDDWNLVTARVGKGKSKWMRKNFRLLCPHQSRTIHDVLTHTHFFMDDFWEDYETLEPGDGIILDEFDGHRRRAMTTDRTTMLERLKRVRSRRVHVFLAYDRVSSLDRDLLTDRNAFWHHAEVRGVMEVRQPNTKLVFTQDGEPIEPTTYPVVGRFPWTEWEPPGWETEYEKKKNREMGITGRIESTEDPWNRSDPLLEAILRRRLNLPPKA